MIFGWIVSLLSLCPLFFGSIFVFLPVECQYCQSDLKLVPFSDWPVPSKNWLHRRTSQSAAEEAPQCPALTAPTSQQDTQKSKEKLLRSSGIKRIENLICNKIVGVNLISLLYCLKLWLHKNLWPRIKKIKQQNSWKVTLTWHLQRKNSTPLSDVHLTYLLEWLNAISWSQLWQKTWNWSMYTGQQAVTAYGMKSKIPPITFGLLLWPRSIFSRAPDQTLTLCDNLLISHALWTEPQDEDWTQDSMCVHSYMQPQQSLFLHRCWVAGESATDEAKHFLHGEGQRAQLNIKHLAVEGRQRRMIVSCELISGNIKAKSILHYTISDFFYFFRCFHSCTCFVQRW